MNEIELAHKALEFAPTPAVRRRIQDFISNFKEPWPTAKPVVLPVIALDARPAELTVKEAAEYLGVTTVWIRTRFAKALHGRPRRVRKEVLDGYAQSDSYQTRRFNAEARRQITEETG